MKKIAILFALAMVAGGIVWAQTTPPTPSFPGAGYGRLGFVNLKAAKPGSIESRSSAGIFLSDVDTFIDPRFHNPQIGTFLYAGSIISSSTSSANASFGFARNVGDLYLAFDYYGSLVDARGYKQQEVAGDDPSPESKYSYSDWTSYFSVLLGIAGMGIRLDARVPTRTEKEREVGKDDTGATVDNLGRKMDYAPSVALTWGTKMGDLAPWARVGYRFPEVNEQDYKSVSGGDTVATYRKLTQNAAFELSGGAEYALGEGAVGGELNLGLTLPAKLKTSAKGASPAPEAKDKMGGRIGAGVSAYYSREFDFGSGVKLGFKPNAGFAITTGSNSVEGDSGSQLSTGDRYTTLDLGVDMGITWQVGQKVAVFGGTSLRAFDWTTWVRTGESQAAEGADKQKGDSSWRVTGFSGMTPRIGMTFTPAENITVGLNLMSFIDGLFGYGTGSTTSTYRPSFDFVVSAKL